MVPGPTNSYHDERHLYGQRNGQRAGVDRRYTGEAFVEVLCMVKYAVRSV